MPYKDIEKQREYQRNWQRKKQTGAGAVQSAKNFLNPDPATARQLLAILTAALSDVVNAEADPIVKARAIAYLVNVGLRGVEISSLEERLTKLEESLNGYTTANTN